MMQKASLTGNDLKKLARLRLREADSLYQQGFYNGCVYLCGYVVECALKARICKFLKLAEYPAVGKHEKIFKTHDFAILKLLAGLEGEITITKNKALFDNWSTATSWAPEQRYAAAGTSGQKKAADILASIKDKPNGVLTWLIKRC
jgi:hypothetical protein